jgi:hypothetical protein
MWHDAGMSDHEQPRELRPIFLDPDASSASPDLPAFLARPASAPVYHGFPLVDGAEVDGFQLGMISGMGSHTIGDAYVVAPDGSRAGLVWESETVEPYFQQVMAPEPHRWGVWGVGLPRPLRTAADARAYLADLLPELRPQWQAWRQRHGTAESSS